MRQPKEGFVTVTLTVEEADALFQAGCFKLANPKEEQFSRVLESAMFRLEDALSEQEGL